MEARELVGVRFHPTDDELVNHYLGRKVRKIQDEICVIPEVNIYGHEPHDLSRVYNEKSVAKSGANESYFFCPCDDSKANYTKRKTRDGFWKETSEKLIVTDEDTAKVIWTKRYFVYHEGSQKNSCRTDWIMHQYQIGPREEDGGTSGETAFSLCHIKLKKKKKKVMKQRTSTFKRRSGSTVQGATNGTTASGKTTDCLADLDVPNRLRKSEPQDQGGSTAVQVTTESGTWRNSLSSGFLEQALPSVCSVNTSKEDQENENKGGTDNYHDVYEDGLFLMELLHPQELDEQLRRDALY